MQILRQFWVVDVLSNLLSVILQHGSSSIQEADDSDSDLEDLHHVIKESRQQLQVAECALKKHRKDVMDTGIYLDPSKYVSIKKGEVKPILSSFTTHCD